MNDTLIAAIQRFTLNARHIMEEEAGNQIDGIYGWLPDGSFAPQKNYPALKQLEEARETRLRLESYAWSEKEAGIDPKSARRKLVRETAFTWLNRMVALRLMEDRILLKTTISRLMESNAYLFWLADEIDPEAHRLHDQGETPTNPMGEGPRHIAYRRFFLWQFGELARDVSVLFDPETMSSRLCPRPIVLKKLIMDMNAADLAEAWMPGNEETIGWMYQAFIAEEKDIVFKGFRKGKKVAADQIAPATQIFTPNWIVRFLVENSLGRFWLEMHPDSRLREKLPYLVPLPKEASRPLKLAKDITFLDPACGSMHFGLVAFDLLFEMYLEEMGQAGKQGWPINSSVQNADEISTAIIFNNLHGIDLDLRAVQLSALALFLRARSKNPRCGFTDCYIACANIEQITGGRLEEFIREAQFDHPIYERILVAMASRLRDSDNLGSLLRLEFDLRRLIDFEKEKAGSKKQMVLDLPGVSDEQFKTKKQFDVFFNSIEEQILRLLDTFTRQSSEPGKDPSHIAAEAVKGLRFLRLTQQKYDVVTTNPPYMSSRNQSNVIAKFLDDQYPDSKGDLYAAFIERCVELTSDGGHTAMITQQSFMFISSYEKLRAGLRNEISIETMGHLGPRAFKLVTGEKVNTTTFIFRKEPDAEKRDQSEGVYFRLVREKDAEAKQNTFELALAALRAGQPHTLVFQYRQSTFDAIPGKPWVYWMTSKLTKMFNSLDLIKNVATPRVGLQTGDNVRFLRKWWEIGKKHIGFGLSNRQEAKKSNKKWFPYMKGGTPIPWLGNQENILIWNNDGEELYSFRPTAVIRNPNFYFLKGVTWSDVSSKGFAARLSPGGFIHDVKGMTCFPKEENIPFILGILNSRFAKYVLAALNPTISNQVGDIERLPVPNKRSDKIEILVNQCVVLARQNSQESEATYDFIHPLHSLDELKARKVELETYEVEIDREVSRLYELNDEDLEVIELELSGPIMTEDVPNATENPDDEEPVAPELMTPSEWALSWISYAVGIGLGRFEIGVVGGLGCEDFSEDIVSALEKLIQEDGILVNDPGQPLDLAQHVWKVLAIMLGETEARERIKTGLGEGDPLDRLRWWSDRFTGQPAASFWKYHFQMYRKRPIYWPLQSPGRHYTVWVFQERFTSDTLFHIRNDIVEPRLRLAEREIADLRPRAEADRRARKELDRLRDFADDLREFSKRIKAITDRGHTPHIDDGVLLNAAPLHEILPSWPDAKKAWQELERGDYDWAYQAMEYWPDRVKEKCKTNKSFSIAHGLENTK